MVHAGVPELLVQRRDSPLQRGSPFVVGILRPCPVRAADDSPRQTAVKRCDALLDFPHTRAADEDRAVIPSGPGPDKREFEGGEAEFGREERVLTSGGEDGRVVVPRLEIGEEGVALRDGRAGRGRDLIVLEAVVGFRVRFVMLFLCWE